MKTKTKHSVDPNQSVGYDKAHCEPFDMPKTNQRVYALTL